MNKDRLIAAGILAGAIAAIFATRTGATAAVFTWVFAGLAMAAFVALPGSWYRRGLSWLWSAVIARLVPRRLRGHRDRAQLLTAAGWRFTTDGLVVRQARRDVDRNVDHPSYMRPADSVPACVRVLALVPCGPLGETPDPQELRDRFLVWLAQAPSMSLIGDLRPGQQDVTWKSWATPRRSNLRADLTGEDQAQVPVASAVLELPSDSVRLAGTDPRYAELIVHVDLPDTSFARGLPDWRRRLTQAVSMPDELAQFLQDLGLALPGEPQAEVGVLLRGRQSLTEIVSPGNIPVLPASSAQIVSEFIGLAIADPDGRTAGETAGQMVLDLSERDLHLNGTRAEMSGEVAPVPGPAGTPAPSRDVVDDDVRFTVYRPQALSPGVWATLLVFAHKTGLVQEPGRPPADPNEQVEARARAHFGGTAATPARADARYELVRGTRLRIVPDLPGIRCNPGEAVIGWWEAVHEVTFRLLATQGLAGSVVRGTVRVWCGVLLLCEVSVAIPVTGDGAVAESGPVAESAPRYRKIFPSYSHRDRAVVASFAEAARALGDQYLQDVLALRAGELWASRLLELIEEADVFQLFWSGESMRSQHCRQEWEHALALQRPSFIRPLYWEEPLPEDPSLGLPPAGLRALHFVRVQLVSAVYPELTYAAHAPEPVREGDVYSLREGDVYSQDAGAGSGHVYVGGSAGDIATGGSKIARRKFRFSPLTLLAHEASAHPIGAVAAIVTAAAGIYVGVALGHPRTAVSLAVTGTVIGLAVVLAVILFIWRARQDG
jgi:TIR domain